MYLQCLDGVSVQMFSMLHIHVNIVLLTTSAELAVVVIFYLLMPQQRSKLKHFDYIDSIIY